MALFLGVFINPSAPGLRDVAAKKYHSGIAAANQSGLARERPCSPGSNRDLGKRARVESGHHDAPESIGVFDME
jgi:hypothetical protein